jgi:hypothetical protein
MFHPQDSSSQRKKIMRTIQSATLVFILGFLLTSAQAMTTYQYVGANYNTVTLNEDPPSGTYTTAMNVSGTFVVGAALGEMSLSDISGQVLSYSFADGRNTLTEGDSEIELFNVAINSLGEITEWQIFVSVPLSPGNTNIGDQRLEITTFDPGNLTRNQATIAECISVNAITGNCSATMADQATAVFIVPIGTWSIVPPPPDADSDGVPDTDDNCTEVPNGTTIPDAGGNSQLDSNGDGYGNACDADLNNDLVVNGLDVGPFVDQFGTSGPDADFNGDGVVNGLDVGPFVDMFGQAPGPSGQAP